eukprot:CAMPEP_0114256506 /NCGR_PEP_ID=MMETSP0058-20121206/18196_1 /TAXON_ID=36894 /ORGANISM="Pyramimonas parkeae, CCMP726" /LENGTH=158 /DNA_ID=CAMNT_0001371091 /DNA_START=103 /DNA_END=579 /DNA_ORIENTATION=-
MNAQIVAVPQEVPEEKAQSTGDSALDLEIKLRWINEKVPLKEGNIMGSQAGAGSGDFHQYRMARRREEFRWARIEKEDQERKEREAFEERKRQRESECADKTNKNRSKRQKKKEKQKATQRAAKSIRPPESSVNPSSVQAPKHDAEDPSCCLAQHDLD